MALVFLFCLKLCELCVRLVLRRATNNALKREPLELELTVVRACTLQEP
jgi:hypothetical protein